MHIPTSFFGIQIQKPPLPRYLLVVLIYAIAFFNFLGIAYGWYWKVRWFDIPMHLAGGAWIALVFLYAAAERFAALPKITKHVLLFLFVLGGVSLLGVLWEFCEFFADFIGGRVGGVPRVQTGLADTLGDLLNDLIGGTVVFIGWLWFTRWNGENNVNHLRPLE